MKYITAWFGSGHAAEHRPCPTCGAGKGKPCHTTTPMPGTSVSDGMKATGLHAARVRGA